MIEKEKIIQAIFSAIDDLNEQLAPEKQLEKSASTVLFGKSAKLDSLGFINLIVAIEEKVEEAFDVIVAIADERAMSQASSPFKTVETLAPLILRSC